MGKMRLRLFILVVFFIFISQFSTFADDGDPAELGPMDEHKVSKIGLNQKILVIYAQADDHRILAGDLAGINTTEDDKVKDMKNWFKETSWNQTTFDIVQQRAAGNDWYLLPEGILDYASPNKITSMEFRDAAQASANNPTPPASVTATAVAPGAADPVSDFDATEAGDYWYAVSGFKNGVESTLSRIGSSVNVAEGQIVKVTITKSGPDDVNRYIIYRTGKGKADNLANYNRIDYANVTGATDEYIDKGTSLDKLAQHNKLLTAAMTAADADVADYEDYNGIIVILFSSFLRGQASQPKTFTVNGTSFKIQAINQSSATGFGRFTHEMGHWLGLPDQYDPVTAGPRGYWTTMDGSDERQYAGWEKDYKLAWITNPDNVKFLERPAPGLPDLDQTFKVVPTATEENSADTYTAIKIKSSESVNYYIEARDKIGGYVSDSSANNLVVVMEAVDAWPFDIYPKRTLNEQKELASGAPAHKPDPTIEITYTGVNAGPPESYNVKVKVKAEEQPDPKITPWGAPPWESSDIWIDSEKEGGGWDDPATALPKPGNGESAWVNHVNRVYARITNIGAGDATGIKVHFKVNIPGGIGDAGQFIDLPIPASVDIPAGELRNIYAEWTPTVDSHTCIKVEIEHIPGEKDIYNNSAQENVHDFYTGTASPWKPVKFPVRVANPFNETRRVDLEINGLQQGWKAHFANKWVILEPKTFKTVDVTITPPADAKPCTQLVLDVYGMTQIDDFIQVYGGLNPIIHLSNPIEFQRLAVKKYKAPVDKKTPYTPYGQLYQLIGVTSPILKNVEIAIILTDPQGKDNVQFATTDESGFFESLFSANQPGTWAVQTYYAGDECNAPTESAHVIVNVPVPKGDFSPWRCCFIVIILLLIILALLIVLLRILSRTRAISGK